MGGKSFALSSLLPSEPLTFTDDAFGGDGTVYELRPAADLSAKEAQWFDVMRKRVATAGDGLEADLMEQMSAEAVQMLIPKLPAERVARYGFAAKMALLTWWQEEQPEGGEARRGQG